MFALTQIQANEAGRIGGNNVPANPALAAPKGQRGKFAPQRADESFTQYQERLALARAKKAEYYRAKRNTAKQAIAEHAAALISQSIEDMNRAIQSRGTAELLPLDKSVAVSIAASGKQHGSDIVAELTTKFSGFSRTTGKVNIPKWQDIGSLHFKRLNENTRAYHQFGLMARSNPLAHIRVIDRTVTQSVRTFGGFDMSDERSKGTRNKVQPREYRESDRVELNTTPRKPFTSPFGRRTPVTLFAHYAIGRADGVYSVTPRAEVSR